MRRLVLFTILMSFSFYLKAQKTHITEFSLKGISFDSLRIAGWDYYNSEVVKYWNQTSKPGMWKYEISDSIWNQNRHLILGKNKGEKEFEYICFYDTSNADGFNKRTGPISPNITADADNVKIEAFYTSSDTIFEDKTMLVYHNFSTIPSQASGLKAMVKYPNFSTFPQNTDKNSATYREELSTCVEAVKDCPDSRFLAMKLFQNINKYHSSNDARLVYDGFSSSIKESECGKEIANALSKDWTHFENDSLVNVLTGKKEKITDENKKIRLICFTASWCASCREEIPLLKEIYNDLKDYSFEMVYISVDRPGREMDLFKKQIKENGILWRSFFSSPAKIDEKYIIQEYPTNMIVYLDNSTEFLEIREKDKRDKLYRLVKEE